MKKIKNRVKIIFSNHKAFFMYGLISVFVTLVDIVVCRICERFTDPVIANTIGVVVGFIIQYFLTACHVYNFKSIKSFALFFVTFLLNLSMANGIIYLMRMIVFEGSTREAAFLISKIASIVFPFFLVYFIRKKIMPAEENENE